MKMGHSTGDTSERNVADEVSRIIEQSKELSELATSLISRTSEEEASLRQRALALRSNIKMLRSFIDSSVKKTNLDPNNDQKMIEELSRVSYTLSEGDATAFLPYKSHGELNPLIKLIIQSL